MAYLGAISCNRLSASHYWDVAFGVFWRLGISNLGRTTFRKGKTRGRFLPSRLEISFLSVPCLIETGDPSKDLPNFLEETLRLFKKEVTKPPQLDISQPGWCVQKAPGLFLAEPVGRWSHSYYATIQVDVIWLITVLKTAILCMFTQKKALLNSGNCFLKYV